ncbi:hypothetical protein [Nocardiopsis changdeensis]|uniref:hypothetical protein n=1 Tax=Nocardiopsis changdeensis TaxID=2831969 RepID=UPI003F48B67E
MQRWEYRIEESGRGLNRSQLDNLGRQGCRLVSEIVLDDPHKGRTIRAIFERLRD